MGGISDITREDSGTFSQRVKDAVYLFLPPLLVEHLVPLPHFVWTSYASHGRDDDVVLLRNPVIKKEVAR